MSSANVPSFLTIPTKPTAPVSHTFFPGNNISPSNAQIVIFVNGLGLPASSWLPSISILQSLLEKHPPLVTYDRFGQGLTTARDPLDSQAGKEGQHDLLDVANDLHEIITAIATSKLGLEKSEVESGKLHIFLVCASIGCPIVRLYAQEHPVAAALFLDSNIANANFSDILPDPDSSEFEPESVISDDCTLQQYREARTKLAAMFDLDVKNAESLDRRSGPSLLPDADRPKLVGPAGIGPLLSVVGHDPVTFAELSQKMMGTPKSLSMTFTNPYWARYNEGLTKITEKDACGGVLIASGCGHFIQMDGPDFVAREISRMIKKLGW